MTDRTMLRARPANSVPLDEPGPPAIEISDADLNAPKRVVYVLLGGSKERINDRIRAVLGLNIENTEIRLVVRGKGIAIRSVSAQTKTEVGTKSARSGPDHVYAVPPYPNPLTALRWVGLGHLRKKLSRYLFFPSGRVLYAYRVIRVLRRAIGADIKAGREPALLTCMPPHDLAIAGLRLKQAFPSLRWYIDWQDLWSYDENYLTRIPRCYRARLLKTERAALELADLNITTNRCAKQVLVDTFGIDAQRVTAIPHHFQSEQSNRLKTALDALEPQDVVTSRSLRMVFLGGLFKPPRVPGEKLLQVCRELRKQHGLDLELHLYGRLPGHCLERPDLVRESGLVVHPRVPYKRIATELSNYDLLVVLLDDLPNCRVVMSIKLPQYLVAGPPILAMVPANSYVAEMVEETGAGYVVDTSSDWVRGLLSVLRTRELTKGLSARDIAATDQFSWDTVSGLWQTVLSGEHPRG